MYKWRNERRNKRGQWAGKEILITKKKKEEKKERSMKDGQNEWAKEGITEDSITSLPFRFVHEFLLISGRH